MSERFVVLAIKGKRDAIPFRELAEYLDGIDLRAEYPATTFIKVLNKDGEQLNYPLDDFLKLLRTKRDTTFQWWWNGFEDTCCRICCANDVIMFEFWLDGHDNRQEQTLISTLRALYMAFARRDIAIGFVVDRTGDTMLYSWREILAGQTDIPGSYPEEIIVPHKLGDKLARHIGDNVTVTKCNGSIMLTRSRRGE